MQKVLWCSRNSRAFTVMVATHETLKTYWQMLHTLDIGIHEQRVPKLS